MRTLRSSKSHHPLTRSERLQKCPRGFRFQHDLKRHTKKPRKPTADSEPPEAPLQEEKKDHEAEKLMLEHVKKAKRNLFEERRHKCDICYKRFKSKHSLEEHASLHSKPLQCKICSMNFMYQRSFLKHVAKHDTFFCDVCSQVFSTYEGLSMHQVTCQDESEPPQLIMECTEEVGELNFINPPILEKMVADNDSQFTNSEMSVETREDNEMPIKTSQWKENNETSLKTNECQKQNRISKKTNGRQESNIKITKRRGSSKKLVKTLECRERNEMSLKTSELQKNNATSLKTNECQENNISKKIKERQESNLRTNKRRESSKKSVKTSECRESNEASLKTNERQENKRMSIKTSEYKENKMGENNKTNKVDFIKNDLLDQMLNQKMKEAILKLQSLDNKGQDLMEIILMQEIESEPDESTLLQCEMCGEIFNYEHDLQIHRTDHPDPVIPPDPPEPATPPNLVIPLAIGHPFTDTPPSTSKRADFLHCVYCGRRMETQSALDLHLKFCMKKNDSPHSTQPSPPHANKLCVHHCRTCGQIFYRKDEFREHVQETLRTLPALLSAKFECGTCHLMFPRKCGLDSHTFAYFLRPPRCKPCNIRFECLNSCVQHRKWHEKQKEGLTNVGPVVKPKWQCEFCKFMFTQNCDLQKHLSERDRLSCAFCKQQFCSVSVLELHQEANHRDRLKEGYRSVRLEEVRQPHRDRLQEAVEFEYVYEEVKNIDPSAIVWQVM